MADLKISQLTAGDPALASDLIPIDRSGTNYAISALSTASLAFTGAYVASGNTYTPQTSTTKLFVRMVGGGGGGGGITGNANGHSGGAGGAAGALTEAIFYVTGGTAYAISIGGGGAAGNNAGGVGGNGGNTTFAAPTSVGETITRPQHWVGQAVLVWWPALRRSRRSVVPRQECLQETLLLLPVDSVEVLAIARMERSDTAEKAALAYLVLAARPC